MRRAFYPHPIQRAFLEALERCERLRLNSRRGRWEWHRDVTQDVAVKTYRQAAKLPADRCDLALLAHRELGADGNRPPDVIDRLATVLRKHLSLDGGYREPCPHADCDKHPLVDASADHESELIEPAMTVLGQYAPSGLHDALEQLILKGIEDTTATLPTNNMPKAARIVAGAIVDRIWP